MDQPNRLRRKGASIASIPVEFADRSGTDAEGFIMRIVYNILIVLMLLGIAAAGAWRAHSEWEWSARVDEARSELQRIQREIALRTTLRDVPLSDRGYPLSIEPQWFQGDVPRNPLLESPRPWLAIAGESQAEMRHPPDPVAHDRDQAMFWYNPHNGRVRARVPAQATHAASIELYNAVNGATLSVE